MTVQDNTVNVRYMVDDVDAAVDFYTTHLGFDLLSSAPPAFADVKRGNLRLLLSGPASSAGRPMPDGRQPRPGGWNRIHLIVDDISTEVARLRAEGLAFRNDIVKGPGGYSGCHGPCTMRATRAWRRSSISALCALMLSAAACHASSLSSTPSERSITLRRLPSTAGYTSRRYQF